MTTAELLSHLDELRRGLNNARRRARELANEAELPINREYRLGQSAAFHTAVARLDELLADVVVATVVEPAAAD